MAGRFRGPLIVPSLVLAGGVLIVLMCAGLIERKPVLTDADIVLARAKKALDRRDFPTAEKLARDALDKGTTIQGGAWIVSGEAIVQQGRFEEAVECFLQVVKLSKQPDRQAMAHALAGDVLARRLHRLGEAETHYRQALELEPNQDNARRGLITLLAAEGRRQAAEEILLSVIRDAKATEQHLFLLGNSEWVINSLSFKTREGDRKVQRQEFLERARQAVPDDPVPVIGLARLADVKNQSARAIELLEGVLAADPAQYEAWCRNRPSRTHERGSLGPPGRNTGTRSAWEHAVCGNVSTETPTTWPPTFSWPSPWIGSAAPPMPTTSAAAPPSSRNSSRCSVDWQAIRVSARNEPSSASNGSSS